MVTHSALLGNIWFGPINLVAYLLETWGLTDFNKGISQRWNEFELGEFIYGVKINWTRHGATLKMCFQVNEMAGFRVTYSNCDKRTYDANVPSTLLRRKGPFIWEGQVPRGLGGKGPCSKIEYSCSEGGGLWSGVGFKVRGLSSPPPDPGYHNWR